MFCEAINDATVVVVEQIQGLSRVLREKLYSWPVKLGNLTNLIFWGKY